MDDTDFFMTDAEQLAIITEMISEGYYFIPSIKYHRPEPLEIREPEEVLKIWNSQECCDDFFIAHDRLGTAPFHFDYVVSRYGNSYSMRDTIGNVHFDLSPCWSDRSVPNKRLYGYVSRYNDFYKDSSFCTPLELTDEHKKMYRDVVKKFKRICFCYKHGEAKRPFWISRGIYEEIKAGKCCISLFDNPDDLVWPERKKR